jgi:penicillin amidase
VRNVIDTFLEPVGLPGPGDKQTGAAIRNLLDNFELSQGFGASGVNFFRVPGVDSAADRRDIVILQSLASGLERLGTEDFAPAFAFSVDQEDYRWGKLHRIVFEHPLGEPFSIPPAGGAFPAPLEGLDGIPTDGGFQSPDAAHHDIRAQSVDEFMFTNGPVNRFAAEVGVRGSVGAESIWPGGTSGVLGSESYVNMLPLWLTNDTIPLAFRTNELRRIVGTALCLGTSWQRCGGRGGLRAPALGASCSRG